MSRPVKIFISTAEVSGDQHGAVIVQELKKRTGINFVFTGIGGPALKKAGVKIFRDYTTKSAVGFTEWIRYVFTGLDLVKSAEKFFKKEKIDLVILIDGQGRNIPIGNLAKKLGIKTAYFFPPQVSIWGKWNADKMKKHNVLLCPFAADIPIYKNAGCNPVFTGHPFSGLKASIDRRKEKVMTGFDPRKKLFALFPGSRWPEVEKLCDIFLVTGAKIAAKHSDVQFVVNSAHSEFTPWLKKRIEKKLPQTILMQGRSESVLNCSDALLTASGTVTLQAAFLKVPMAVCYKVSKITYWVGRALVKTKWFSMINILARKTVSREFLNSQVNANDLAEYCEKLLFDKKLRTKVLNDFARVTESISTADPYGIICNEISRLLPVQNAKLKKVNS